MTSSVMNVICCVGVLIWMWVIETVLRIVCAIFFFFKQKTAYEMRISDWSSDVCSSDLLALRVVQAQVGVAFKPGFEQCARNRLDAGSAGLRQQLQPSRVVVMRQHAVQVEQDNGRHVAHALATRNA